MFDLDQWRKLIEKWQGLLTALGLLLSTAVGLRTNFLQWDPSAWSWREFIFALIGIVIVVVMVIRTRIAQASRLIDPEALKLDPKSPDHLIGRSESLDRLERALVNPLVFLVGKSGCGKSALLRAGVAQGSSFMRRFLPIYIDMSVLDWERGPLRSLRDEFSLSLLAEDPARGLLDAGSTPEAYSDIFLDFHKRTRRRPLLLLDQFDDYQALPKHRTRFLPSETRIWRRAEEIAQDNAFWRVLRQCLDEEAVNIIVACREDASPGLETLRFDRHIPYIFDLPRLEQGFVRMIFDRLTERPSDKLQVIVNPQGGWTALRDRLVDDLEFRGQVLPQQLKVVLGGLRTSSSHDTGCLRATRPAVRTGGSIH